jgi:hypothetical protein
MFSMTCVDHCISECSQKVRSYWWYAADIGRVIGALSACHLESQEGAWEAVLEPMTSVSAHTAP